MKLFIYFAETNRDLLYFFVINEILGPFWPANEFIRSRAFVVRFGVTSGEFARAMVGILARRSLAKILMERTYEVFQEGTIGYLPKFSQVSKIS